MDATVASKLSVVRSFFEYLNARGCPTRHGLGEAGLPTRIAGSLCRRGTDDKGGALPTFET